MRNHFFFLIISVMSCCWYTASMSIGVSGAQWVIRNRLAADPKDPKKNAIDVRISFGQHNPQNQWITNLQAGHEQTVSSAGCVTMHRDTKTRAFDTFEMLMKFSSDPQWLRGMYIENKTNDWANESAYMACLNTVYLDVVSFKENPEDGTSWFHLKIYEQKPK